MVYTAKAVTFDGGKDSQNLSVELTGSVDGKVGDLKFIDLSIAANRREFIVHAGKVVDPKASSPTDTAPSLVFEDDE